MTRFRADDAGEVEIGGRGRLGGGKGGDDGDVDKTCRFAVQSFRHLKENSHILSESVG